HGQGWTLSTNNEWNVFLSNTPFTPDYKTGHFGQRRFDQIDPQARAYMKAILPHESPYAATLEQRNAMKAAALDYMIDHPLRTLYRMSNRLRSYVSMDYTASRGIQNAYGLSNALFAPLIFFEGTGYLFLLLLAVSAPFLTKMPMAGKGALVMSIAIAGMIPYLLAFAQPRYHLPAIPLILLAAVIALAEIVQNPRITWVRLRSRGLWWGIVVAIAGIQVENLYYLIQLR
ncbi:MAG: hypothetical protein NTX15_02530, partial [Candidatus Kapabacteria bacterium]|nr:hypothetical protein [Candidatus Kapabacteria bacterium]